MVDDQLLEGVDILKAFSQMAPMLMRGQLELDPPFVVLLRVSTQRREVKQASSLHKGGPNKLFGHTLLKLKSSINGLEPFLEENESFDICTWVML